MNEQKFLKAGKIASEIKEWIKPQIKKGTPLIEIAEKIENKIKELGAKPSFPVNLSIDEQAAHYTPEFNDKRTAQGLLKVDFGAHVDGWISDTAFSVDLENSALNKKIILASEKALNNVEKNIESKKEIGQIGKIIEQTIKQEGFNPVTNLTGHSLDEYDLHSGLSIPNIDNKSKIKLGECTIAIEPFATNGKGNVHEGNKGNILILNQIKNTRNSRARKILDFIKENYGTLPFASRWIIKKFGPLSKIALLQLEKEEILYQFPILTEEKGKLVSQTENTFLIKKDKIIITTK